MGHNVTIGGERLGSGKKMKAYLHNYERSTHDKSFVWRSTMAAGTLVPFWTEVALPGDTFDIDLNVDVLTHPTIGPLFGTYKIQLDIFQIPIRLYQGKLHMNMLGIGMDMSKVPFPVIQMEGDGVSTDKPVDNQQINPSSIWSYLGIRGLGINVDSINDPTKREFNAIAYLGYWDIYKNYYANKQEEIGAMIHKDTAPYNPIMTQATLYNIWNATAGNANNVSLPLARPVDPITYTLVIPNNGTTMRILGTNILAKFDPFNSYIGVQETLGEEPIPKLLGELFRVWDINPAGGLATGSDPDLTKWKYNGGIGWTQGLSVGWVQYTQDADTTDDAPQIITFPLENIDTMRKALLAHTTDVPYAIDKTTYAPYGPPMANAVQADTSLRYSAKFSQEGLALKTYQSDLFNNWISTEWIDGPDGISEITAIDTSAGSFTIDELNMSKKVYEMLNRIAISGGSYDDWLDAVYTHERQRSAENPMYLGGLIRNLVFQEVVSNAATDEAPLGTLAGRGKVGQKDKGGHVIAKVDEPSYLMGIISLTPNIDYSQGNQWDVNLKTMNDLHKPALDEIGYQDLVTDQMAWFDTLLSDAGVPTYRSAGKQPAWLNYMTNVNVVKGNFAEQNEQMFMVLNRRYDISYGAAADDTRIKDLTTYIDPSKFNHIFADTRRDAQNFWAQIHVGIEARRKMSAKIMPNL